MICKSYSASTSSQSALPLQHLHNSSIFVKTISRLHQKKSISISHRSYEKRNQNTKTGMTLEFYSIIPYINKIFSLYHGKKCRTSLTIIIHYQHRFTFFFNNNKMHANTCASTQCIQKTESTFAHFSRSIVQFISAMQAVKYSRIYYY